MHDGPILSTISLASFVEVKLAKAFRVRESKGRATTLPEAKELY